MRRYDLDWIRVIVFGLLIFYHVGMFFVPWEFHLKNNIIYPSLRWPMLFVNQWRLPILFVISGMGTYYALSRRSGGQFVKERVLRLLIPLIAGIVFIVPPQVYLERLSKGQISGGLFEFWPLRAFTGIYPEGNFSWHHLWFLPYLLIFSIALLPLFLHLRKYPEGLFLMKLRKLALTPLGLFWFIIPLYLWEAFLEPFFPSTHALIGDWFNIANYFTLFLYGFLLIFAGENFWKSVVSNRLLYLKTGITGFCLLSGVWIFLDDNIIIHFTEALVKVINLWAWILAIFGYSAAYLNRSGSVLIYANQAVYPFYIIHQTIILVLGFYIMNLDWGFFLKFSFMTAGTFGISWVIYEFGIRRWLWVRPLFGLKKISTI